MFYLFLHFISCVALYLMFLLNGIIRNVKRKILQAAGIGSVSYIKSVREEILIERKRYRSV